VRPDAGHATEAHTVGAAGLKRFSSCRTAARSGVLEVAAYGDFAAQMGDFG
jgi:hypothetical protein